MNYINCHQSIAELHSCGRMSLIYIVSARGLRDEISQLSLSRKLFQHIFGGLGLAGGVEGPGL